MSQEKERLTGILLAALILAVFIYVAVRACTLSITHDECLSFRIVLGDKDVARSANDHLLNTMLMRISCFLFGSSELALRLPNLAGFAFFCFYTFRILRRLKNVVLMVAGFCLLLLNPYTLDYFGLARGYGLSLGLAMPALYYLFRQERYDSFDEYFKSVLRYLGFSLLAAFASYICINLNLSLLLLALVSLYFLVKGNQVKLTGQQLVKLVVLFTINCLFIGYLVNKLLHLKATGELEFGGSLGFIEDNLTLLIQKTIYKSYYGEVFWKVARTFVLAIFAGGLFFQLVTRKYNEFSKISMVLFLMINCLVLQHFGFDSFYPPVRSSTIYIVLFGLFLIFLLKEISGYLNLTIRNVYFSGIAIVVCLPLTFHFIQNMNISYCNEWHNNANTKAAMMKIRNIINIPDAAHHTYTISNEWYEEPVINYYKLRYNLLNLAPANRELINTRSDFIYCEELKMDTLIHLWNYVPLEIFKETHTVLLQKTGTN